MERFRTSSRKADDHLETILDEATHWTVNGRQGQVLCSAASLRLAIDRAAQYTSSGAVVTAICRQPGDNIIVFAEQMARLRQTIAVRRMASPAAA
jgi:hypothetical protein